MFKSLGWSDVLGLPRFLFGSLKGLLKSSLVWVAFNLIMRSTASAITEKTHVFFSSTYRAHSFEQMEDMIKPESVGRLILKPSGQNF